MRSGNEAMAYGAVCQLYVISSKKAWGGLNENLCLRTLREPQLLSQVVQLIQGPSYELALDPSATGPSPTPSSTSLLIACLSLIESLAGDARCREVLNQAGWLDALVPLLSCEESIVALMADRVLVRMHHVLVVNGSD